MVTDGYVGAETGTGIVHCAPAFGEDDYRVCVTSGVVAKDDRTLLLCSIVLVTDVHILCLLSVGIPCPVDDNGRFTEQVPEYQGEYVKACDPKIMASLKERGRLLASGTIT